MDFEELLNEKPYSLGKEKKEKVLTQRLVELTEKHRENCPEYYRILDSISFSPEQVHSYKELPFLPVRLFKELSLKSVPQENVIKTMTSSGTSGQAVSKIYLDRETSGNQQRIMTKIVNDFIGSSRVPMIVLDCPSVIKDRSLFSARGAGILGFSIFGAKRIYALKDDMQLDVPQLQEFLEQYKGQKILLFGFTFMIWQYFYKELLRLEKQGITFDLSQGTLIHGGGWKKLIYEAVREEDFRQKLYDICGLEHIHDYYGMVEQTGCIYMQCEHGHLHASNFSDVIIRNPEDFGECEIGETGIIQVVSTIPESYPGHSLLTEDQGVILGEDDCPCGRKGKYFKVLGRMKHAEIRGCSDTFQTAALDDKSDFQRHNHQILEEQKIRFLVGDAEILKSMPCQAPMVPFSESVMEFLMDLSKELLAKGKVGGYADVVTLGYWLRKASLCKMKENYDFQDGNIHVGRGMAFHIAPSNVPVNYAYSLVTGLLCGNANVVRIPSKEYPQIPIIDQAINNVLERYPTMKPYICLIRYPRDRAVNDWLSAKCDVRIIWGGDASIADLRKSPLSPRATEITFADRYSFAVLDADAYLALEDKDRLALDFYNDTYLSDQNACTSPRVVVWMGDEKESAKAIFWEKLYALVKEKYVFQAIQAVDKLTMSHMSAIHSAGSHELPHCDNRLVRIKVERLDRALMDYRGNCGYFYEYECEDILELREFCNDPGCQTLGLLGDVELVMPLLKLGLKGVDRVTSLGHTMDFSLLWDGYNLVDELTRVVTY